MNKKYFYPETSTVLRHDYEEELDSFDSFPCTLLIPNDLYEIAMKHLDEYGGSFSIMFREVLKEHRTVVFQDWFPKARSIKTRYQRREGENSEAGFRKVCFRATSRGWSLLGSLSIGSGLSRCFVFALLLRVALGLLEIVHTATPYEESRKTSITVNCSRTISTKTGKFTRRLRHIHKLYATYDYAREFWDSIVKPTRTMKSAND